MEMVMSFCAWTNGLTQQPNIPTPTCESPGPTIQNETYLLPVNVTGAPHARHEGPVIEVQGYPRL